MVQAMAVSLTTIRSAARAPTHGPIKGLIKAPGQTIKWTVLGFSRGQMAVSTSVSTRTITNMGMEFLCGQMANDMRASGARDINMVKGLVRCLMGVRSRDSGRKERSLQRTKGTPAAQ